MSIKRYTPKFKKLARFRQPIWLEKRGKIVKFNRQKWETLKKNYSPRKYKFFNQDVAACNLGKNFNDEKFIRLKKTYKNLLQEKQRLQLYYGAGRMRYYQLKRLARKAFQQAKIKKLSTGTVMLNLLESRLKNVVYRLGFVSSVMQAKKLINCSHVKVSGVVTKNATLNLQKFDSIVLDPALLHDLTGRYLKSTFPFFFFRYKDRCREIILKKAQSFSKPFVENNLSPFLEYSRTNIQRFKNSIVKNKYGFKKK